MVGVDSAQHRPEGAGSGVGIGLFGMMKLDTPTHVVAVDKQRGRNARRAPAAAAPRHATPSPPPNASGPRGRNSTSSATYRNSDSSICGWLAACAASHVRLAAARRPGLLDAVEFCGDRITLAADGDLVGEGFGELCLARLESWLLSMRVASSIS